MAEPTAAERRAYIASLDDLATRFERLDHETIKRMVELLQETRRGIQDMLAGAPDNMERARLVQLRASVDSLVRDFQLQLQRPLTNALGEAFEVGGQSVLEPLDKLGIQAGFNVIAPVQLNIATDISAELIQKIGDDMRSTINSQLRLAMLGSESPFTAMQRITRTLGVKARDLRWGRLNRPEVVQGVAARAEAIVRTEMNRAHNLGHHSQQKLAAQEIRGLKKRWMATGDRRTRRNHLQVHKRTFREPIAIKDKFKVGRSRMLYPGDPRGEAKETINCRCRLLTVPPDIGVIETPQDEAINDELDKRNS